MQESIPEILIVIAAGTFLMLALVVFIFIFMVLYQKRKIKEQEKHHQLLESNQEKVLAATLQTQEEERKRMARDLHDELGNVLAIAKMNLGRLSKNVLTNADQETASQTYSLIDEALKNVRRLSRDLHPVMLEKYGLAAALEALGKKCASDSLAISIKTSGELTGLPGTMDLNIFRIVQELLSNALKHSQATLVELELDLKPQQLLISYQDNGLGFHYPRPFPSPISETGIGLITIDSRVRILKGSWQLESQPGQGTKATFSLPLVNKNI